MLPGRNAGKGGGWFVKLLSVEVDSEEVASSSTAAIDSGTSMIVGPATAVEEIWSYMNKYVSCVKSKANSGNQSVMCTCADVSPSDVFPEITITLGGGFEARLSPDMYVI